MAGQRAYTEDEVAAMAAELGRRGRNRERDRVAFLFGILTGFRATEICSVRLGDVTERNGEVAGVARVWRRNMKGKRRTREVVLGPELRGILEAYLRTRASKGVIHKDEWLFGQQGGKPITRHTLYQAQKGAAERLGLRGRCGGTHGMRKTYARGVHEYLQGVQASGVPVDVLLATRDAMGHSDTRSTEAYVDADRGQVLAAVLAVGRRFCANPQKGENGGESA